MDAEKGIYYSPDKAGAVGNDETPFSTGGERIEVTKQRERDGTHTVRVSQIDKQGSATLIHEEEGIVDEESAEARQKHLRDLYQND